MKIDICSDLHLEFGDLELPGGELLIIAGDLFEARELKHPEIDAAAIACDKKRDRSRLYRFLKEQCSEKYKLTLIVMGNHEHYHSRFEKTAEYLRARLPENIILLDNDSHEHNGILFLGATLWTDFNHDNPISHSYVGQLLNDYKHITQFNAAHHAYHKLTTRRTFVEHKKTLAYFQKKIDENAQTKNLPVVVITHHAPTFMSVSRWFAHDTHGNAGFASDLSDFMLDNPSITAWIHGHLHNKSCYEIGDAVVFCNPRGYVGHEEITNEFRTRWIEVNEYGLIDHDDWH